jgi:hypothetical protein
MWKTTDEEPMFGGTIPIWVKNNNINAEHFEQGVYINGSWYIENFSSDEPYLTFEEMKFELIAWFDVPKYR